MAALSLTVNTKKYIIDADPQMPLLWVIRDMIGLTGTKFGCGIAQCGACTVHLDGKAIRSCTIAVSTAEGKSVTTIEGLTGAIGHRLQAAWLEEDVPQCGYCQSGQEAFGAVQRRARRFFYLSDYHKSEATVRYIR